MCLTNFCTTRETNSFTIWRSLAVTANFPLMHIWIAETFLRVAKSPTHFKAQVLVREFYSDKDPEWRLNSAWMSSN